MRLMHPARGMADVCLHLALTACFQLAHEGYSKTKSAFCTAAQARQFLAAVVGMLSNGACTLAFCPFFEAIDEVSESYLFSLSCGSGTGRTFCTLSGKRSRESDHLPLRRCASWLRLQLRH